MNQSIDLICHDFVVLHHYSLPTLLSVCTALTLNSTCSNPAGNVGAIVGGTLAGVVVAVAFVVAALFKTGRLKKCCGSSPNTAAAAADDSTPAGTQPPAYGEFPVTTTTVVGALPGTAAASQK